MDDADAANAEQVFFEDPALDRMFGVVFRIATELQLMRATVQRLEALLGRQGTARADASGDPDATEERLAAEHADRVAYVEHILSPLLGLSGSRSAP